MRAAKNSDFMRFNSSRAMPSHGYFRSESQTSLSSAPNEHTNLSPTDATFHRSRRTATRMISFRHQAATQHLTEPNWPKSAASLSRQRASARIAASNALSFHL